MSYGSPEGVQALSPHLKAASGKPSVEQIEQWLVERSAHLTAWIVAAGYDPVAVEANTTAKLILDAFANNGATCDAERSILNNGGDEDDQNRRDRVFCAEFAKAEAWINGGVLKSLELTQTVAPKPTVAQSSTARITVVW